MAGYFKKVLVPRTVQPEPGVGVNQKWLDRGLVALFDCRQAMELISGDRATNDTTTFGPSGDGVAADFSSTANQQYAHRGAYAITSAITIVALCDIDALTNYGAIISKEGTTTSNMPYELRIGNSSATDSKLFLGRAAAAGGIVSSVFASNLISTPLIGGMIIVSSSSGLIQNPAVAHINNVKTQLSISGAATGNCSDNGSSVVWIGRRHDGATQLDGRIYYVALFSRDLSDDENNELYLNRFDLYEPEEINVWVPTGGTSPTVITLDPAAFNLTPQGTQNTLGATLTTSALNFTAQDVQNSATNNLTAAAFDFVAHDIAAENASTATVTLDTATFDFVANDTQNLLHVELSTPAFDFVPNGVQNLLAHSLTACTFDFAGQDLQNRLGVMLDTAIFDFVTRSITAGDPLTPSTGRATNMMLMGVGN